MVLTRAFACAMPVVASDIPGYRAVVEPETAVCSFRRATAALAAAVVDAARGRAGRGSGAAPAARELVARALRVGRHRAAAARRSTRTSPARRARLRQPAARLARPAGDRRARRVVGALRCCGGAGPAWRTSSDAFTAVAGLGRSPRSCSTSCRSSRASLAWRTVIDQAVPPPRPRFRLDLRRVLGRAASRTPCCPGGSASSRASPCSNRRMPRASRARGRRSSARSSRTASSTSSPVLAAGRSTSSHRGDPALGGDEPRPPSWASASALLAFAVARARTTSARRSTASAPCGGSLEMARQGLARDAHAVGRGGGGLVPDARLDCASCFAVWAAMRGFHIHEPICRGRRSCSLLMNVATIFPLWPGNVGLLQAAVALAARAATASRTRTASRSGSGCRRSRRRSASGSGWSSSRARGSRSRCCKRMPDAAQAEVPEEEASDAGDWRRRRASKASCRRSTPLTRSRRGCAPAARRRSSVPVADGGDGTLDVLRAALGGEWREVVGAARRTRPRAAGCSLPRRRDGGASSRRRRSGSTRSRGSTRCARRAAGSAS